MNPLVCALVLQFIALPLVTQADIVVWTNFTDFEARLDDVATTAGVGLFSSAEKSQIKAGVIAGLQTAYQDFTVTFTEDTSGGFNERMLFGADTTAPGYGASSSDDFRNPSDFGIASIYTKNFAPLVDTNVSRAQQIQELTFALSGTAAHELGHSFGLEHHDSYGTPGIVRSSGGVIDSGGLQNQHLMATGLTGISIDERQVERTFSDLSLAKLEWSRGLTDNTPTSVFELTDNNDDFGTAQHIDIDQSLAISGYESANVIGSAPGGGSPLSDYYSFDLSAGDLLTMELNSFDNEGTDFVDGFLILYDPLMNQIGSVNNTIYNGDDLGDFVIGGDGTADNLFLNVEALVDGTYFAELRTYTGPPFADPNGTGDYELLFLVAGAGMDPAAVPELGSMALLGLTGLGFGYVRRRKQQVKHSKDA